MCLLREGTLNLLHIPMKGTYKTYKTYLVGKLAIWLLGSCDTECERVV